MRHEAAIRRIESFGKRFGPSRSHLYLAYHAAFPLALTPDLLYRIWANFQRDIHRKLLNIPWIAVADILLSNLCDEIGHELYEMDVAVRNELLKQLQEDSRFGEKRINELSNFLLAYVRKDLNSSESDQRDFAQSQRWTALAYVRPNEAAHELKLELTKAYQQDKSELVRIASLVETIADPLKEFEPLLIAARAVKPYVRGDFKSTAEQLGMKVKQNHFGEIHDDFKLRISKELDSIFLPHKRIKVIDKKSYIKAANLTKKLRAMNRDSLVVGINRYPFLSHLSTAAFDAEAIAQILEQYGNFQVRRFPHTIADSTLQVDPNTTVTAAELENAITQLFLPNGNNIPDTALLFFAGHGLRRQLENTNLTEGYLATSDSIPRKEKWGISLKWLRELLRKSPVRQQIVWLDCCNSGELFNFTEDDLLDESTKQSFFITASREFEVAYSSLSTQHGALTEVLLKGLDPTRNSEGLINNFTLTRFIEDNFRKTPQRVMIKRGDREILLTCTNQHRLESLLLKQYQTHAKQASPTPLLTWKYAHTLTGHIDIVKSIAISPDRKLIASGSLDKTIKLWLIDTGELLHTIAGHSSAVLSLAFSPDSQTLASASNMESLSATIKLWNVSTGNLQTTLGSSLLALRTSCLAFSPDGLTLASGHLDAKIRLWNLGTCQIRGTLKGHGWDVNSLTFSSDGKILVSGALDGAIKIWNWHKQELLKTLNRPAPSQLIPSLVSWFDSSVGGIWAVAISPDGKIIASGGSDQPINLWDADTGKLLRTLTEHSGSIYTVAFSPDGKTFASGGDDHKIRIWEFQTGKLLETLEHLGPVQSIGFSLDGQTLVSGSADATVKIWQRS